MKIKIRYILEKLRNEFFNKDINHQGKIVVFSSEGNNRLFG